MERHKADAIYIELTEAVNEVLVRHGMKLKGGIRGSFGRTTETLSGRFDAATLEEITDELAVHGITKDQEFPNGNRTFRVTGETAKARHGIWVMAADTVAGTVYKFKPSDITRGATVVSGNGEAAPPSAGNWTLKMLTDRDITLGESQFEFQHKSYKVVGTKKARTSVKNPHGFWVLVTRQPDGRRFKFPLDTVLNALGKS